MDASGEAATSEGLGDNIARSLAVVMSFLHDVDEVMLNWIQSERDYVVGVVDVSDIVFSDSPVSEIEFLAELVEGFSCSVDGGCVKDSQRGFSVEKALYFGMLFHDKREEEDTVRNGADVEFETETCRVVAGILVNWCIHVGIIFFGDKDNMRLGDMGLILIN